MGASKFFKVKLASGRILGPLDLERVRLLILKNQIVGSETAREYPDGEWGDISRIPDIAELLLSRADGRLANEEIRSKEPMYRPMGATEVLPGATEVLPGTGSLGTLPELQTLSHGGLKELPSVAATVVLPETPSAEENDRTIVNPLQQPLPPIGAGTIAGVPGKSGKTAVTRHSSPSLGLMDPDDEKTRVDTGGSGSLQLEEGTVVAGANEDEEVTRVATEHEQENAEAGLQLGGLDSFAKNIAQERTVVFQRSTDATTLPGKRRAGPKEILKAGAIALALGLVGYELFLSEPTPTKQALSQAPVRPRHPAPVQGKADPQKSVELYNQAIRHYMADNIVEYRKAVELFQASASYDMNNTKTLAMLASTYLNLIDASNKDESYFSVISKLIDMSRAKAADLPETVIAEVEFFVTINGSEAAQNRINDYTKAHPTYPLEMFYYIAYVLFARGDAMAAARFVGPIPDNKVYTPKIYYLRGKIAEKLNDSESALKEYAKAVTFNRDHARSRLRIVDLLASRGKLKEGAVHLDYLVTNPLLLAPKELARAYYLHSQLNQLYQKYDLALGDIERSVKLDKDSHDYLLEMYTLRAKVGDSIQAVQKEARMYYFLSEGEKLLKAGRQQEALAQFLQARQANDKSSLPPIKIGDMFYNMHNIGDARVNYKLAADRSPNNVEVWSKYISTLIQSYEWEEADTAMKRFRNLPVNQSFIDKAAGDMYARQNRHMEAQLFYKKAMARESIDPDVYIAYAKSMMAARNFKDAPFFLALALRYDPLNIDAITSTAKCIAATAGVDRGISMLQDELQKSVANRASSAAIAEFQIQKGEWAAAQQFVDQAMLANPDYAYVWKLQAQIYMNREGLDKDALDKALASFKSYSDRNSSDPSGYLERYRIFIKKTEFEQAGGELERIHMLYPKYPNLHYYKGALYSYMGNHQVAVEEFTSGFKNNPFGVNTRVALGKELVEVGKYKEALVEFNKAMAMSPTAAEPKHQSGWANCLLKNYQGGIALMQQSIVYDKGNPQIYKHLGQCYEAAGDGVGARNAYRKYLEMEPDAPDKAQFERYL